MSWHSLSDDELKETLQVLEENGGNKTYAAKQLGITRSALRNRLRRAAERGLDGSIPESAPDGFVVKSQSRQYDQDGNLKGQAVRFGQDHGGEFEAPEGFQPSKLTAQLDANGNLVQQWPRWTNSDRDAIRIAKGIREVFEGFEPLALPALVIPSVNEDLLNIYPIADAHHGLKACAGETGDTYDLDIGIERFSELFPRLLQQAPNSEQCLFPVLGDWTHVDDDWQMTPTSKHTLQVSDPLQTIVEKSAAIMVQFIRLLLEKHKTVIVKIIKGNHDLSIYIAFLMAAHYAFEKDPRVIVDMDEADYWFFRFGRNLTGFHHGHRMKPEQMAQSMPTECRQEWAETDYHLFLHGHFHTEKVKEIMGVRVECMRTIANQDAHHAGKYNSGRSLISITQHKTDGEQSRGKINLPRMSRPVRSFGDAA